MKKALALAMVWAVTLALMLMFSTGAWAGPFIGADFENGTDLVIYAGASGDAMTLQATLDNLGTYPTLEISTTYETAFWNGNLALTAIEWVTTAPFTTWPPQTASFIPNQFGANLRLSLDLAALLSTGSTFEVYGEGSLVYDTINSLVWTWGCGFYFEIPWPEPILE